MAKKRYIKNNSKYVAKKIISQDSMVKYFEKDHLTTTSLSKPNNVSIVNDGINLYLYNNISDNKLKKYNFNNFIYCEINKDLTVSTYEDLDLIVNKEPNMIVLVLIEDRYYQYNADTQTFEYKTKSELCAQYKNNTIYDKNELKLNPDNTKITTYCYYGNSVEHLRTTITKILKTFPAEIFLPVGGESVYYYYDDDGNEQKIQTLSGSTLHILSNPFNINVKDFYIEIGPNDNELRFFSSSVKDYICLDDSNTIYYEDIIWSGVGHTYDIQCPKNGDLLYTIPLTNTINIYGYYVDGEEVLFHDSPIELHIRPKTDIINSFFNELNGFEKNLLNRNTYTKYSMYLQKIQETETGDSFYIDKYIWPLDNGGWNIDSESKNYQIYLDNLISTLKSYDEKYTDNLWRMLCHESVKNYNLLTDKILDELKFKKIIYIYGRQLDEIKLYIDSIKLSNNINYNEINNASDYMLSKMVSTDGWDYKNIFKDNSIQIDTPLYDGNSDLYTAYDANKLFLKQLKICGRYIQSCKGTKRALNMTMALLGVNPDDYELNEYIGIATSGYTNYSDTIKYNQRFCEINNFESEIFSDKFYGLQTKGITTSSGDVKNNYIIPWFPKKTYDDSYFQMKGGWGYSNTKYINENVSQSIKKLNSGDNFLLFNEESSQIYYVNNLSDLINIRFSVNNDAIYYVKDLTGFDDLYVGLPSGYTKSNYFVLKNNTLQNTLGFDNDISDFGWRVVYYELLNGMVDYQNIEFINGELIDANRVIYANTILDKIDGNKPHIGKLKYDRGEEYIQNYKQLFSYLLGKEEQLTQFDDDEINKLNNIGFNIEKHIDNKKCWYFTDNSNIKYSETENADGTFFYKDGASITQDNTLPVGSGYSYNILSDDYNYDTNIYKNFKNNIRPVDFQAYNLIGGDTNDKLASYSIINTKTLILKNKRYGDAEFIGYLNNVVIPFIAQIIPATTLFEYDIYNKIQTNTNNIKLTQFKQSEYINIWSENELNTEYINDYLNISFEGSYGNNYIFLVSVDGNISDNRDTTIRFSDVNGNYCDIDFHIMKFPYIGTFIIGDGTIVGNINN